jgi:hypothetical protein
MEFDFENYEKYLVKSPSAEAQVKINKLNSMVDAAKLRDSEMEFLDIVRKRMSAEKSLTDKQRILLAKILQKCNK